jgi:hypothetical protein
MNPEEGNFFGVLFCSPSLLAPKVPLSYLDFGRGPLPSLDRTGGVLGGLYRKADNLFWTIINPIF